MCLVPDPPKPKDPPPPAAPVAPVEAPKPMGTAGVSTGRKSSGLSQLRMSNRAGEV